MTLSITIISFLVGAVLAQQFKVRVLLPAFAVVMVLAIGGRNNQRSNGLVYCPFDGRNKPADRVFFWDLRSSFLGGCLVQKVGSTAFHHNFGTARIALALLPRTTGGR